MLRIRFICIFILFISLSFKCITNKNPLNIEVTSQADLLNEAYEKNSKDSLKIFLNNWHKEYNFGNQSDIKNDTTKLIYDIFRAFYKPFNLSIYDDHLNDSTYFNISYVIVQNSISYVIIDSIVFDPPYPEEYLNYNNYNKIKPFYPYVNINNINTLILTTKYDSIINNFLGDRKSINEDYILEKERINKQMFLNNYIKIIRGHWGYGWLINTYPVAQVMMIDKTFTKVLIEFEYIYNLGEAYLERKNNEWIFISSKISVTQ
jgi:hypothetical protein